MHTVALAGCGHMGRHHARTVSRHTGWRLAAVVDPIRERAEAVAEATGARVCAALPDDVDAVIVASTTGTHLEVAGPAVARGQWCLVEKPVAVRAADGAALASDRVVVGHCERFNPAVRAVGRVRPSVVRGVRAGPASPRAAGVDVVTDLMIHDLDLLAHWGLDLDRVVLERAEGVRRDGVWTEARFEGQVDGVAVSLLATRRSREARRELALDTEDGALDLDLLRGVARGPEGARAPLDGHDALAAQWAAFTDAVRGTRGGVTTGVDGLRALALAERLRDALEEVRCV